jgi:hypothetical protein
MVGVLGFEPRFSASQAQRVRPDFPTPRDSRAWSGRVQIGRGIDDSAIAAHIFLLLLGRQAFRVRHSDPDKKQHAQHFQRSHETIKPQHLAVVQPGPLPHKRVNADSTGYRHKISGAHVGKPQALGVDAQASISLRANDANKRDSRNGYIIAVLRSGDLNAFVRTRSSMGCRCAWPGRNGPIVRMSLLYGYRSVYASGGLVQQSPRWRAGQNSPRRRQLERVSLGTNRGNLQNLDPRPIGRCQWRVTARLARAYSERANGWGATDSLMGAGFESVYRAKSPDPLRRSTAPSLWGYTASRSLREPDSNRHFQGYEPRAGTVPVHPAKTVYHNSRFPQLGISCEKGNGTIQGT